ncbi:hypothetical protein GIX45_28435 [Erwinia sp. CPCC 100877]|nr:hypothetical protein [Erwinia sp. CPCC 100877]
MQNFITIYGELITGEIVAIHKNTVIVRTAKGGHHMVHKDSLDDKYKSKRGTDRLKCQGFDLQACQTLGGKKTEIRKWRKIQ